PRTAERSPTPVPNVTRPAPALYTRSTPWRRTADGFDDRLAILADPAPGMQTLWERPGVIVPQELIDHTGPPTVLYL
ncbi:hypothetical protein, partial [Streptomyces sp. NPDC046832]|uniref:hypothetical protein n=1 Tax=Streptomyces sp. NPDC046832 TaxID=3155020 RepID=UPI0034083678